MQQIDMSNTTINYADNVINYENIKNHATRTISSSILCDEYFLIPRNIVSSVYPANLFTNNELKRYLLFFRYRTGHTGCSSSGNKSFNHHFGYINPNVFKNTTNYLHDNGFIRFKNMKGKSTVFELCMPPFYDIVNNVFIPSSQYPMSNNKISQLKQHFIQIPKLLFDNEFVCKRADISTLYTILKLYRYNFPNTFGGVDFNLLRREDDSLIIHDNLYYDLHMTKNEFTNCIDCLINENLFYWSQSNVSVKQLEFEEVMQLSCVNSYKNIKQIDILVPRYQIATSNHICSVFDRDITL